MLLFGAHGFRVKSLDGFRGEIVLGVGHSCDCNSSWVREHTGSEPVLSRE